MHFRIQFLLIVSILVMIGETVHLEGIEKAINDFLKKNGESKSCAFDSIYYKPNEYSLFFRKKAKITQTHHALFWKGVNEGNVVLSVKINTNAKDMTHEANILEYLNAQDPDIEAHGIPRIYFSGTIMLFYIANGMTLFHGNLIDVQKRYRKNKLKLSDLSVLVLFKGTVKALKFLSEHGVVHNDIQPENIFVRGDQVFICNFDIAVGPDDKPHRSALPTFASSNWHKHLDRNAMDDFESLVFTIWNFVGIKLESSGKSESHILSEFPNRADAKSRMEAKCDHFKDEHARTAFKTICGTLLLSEDPIPDYSRILAVLDDAISKIEANSEPEHIDWMGRGTEVKPSKDTKYSKWMPCLWNGNRK